MELIANRNNKGIKDRFGLVLEETCKNVKVKIAVAFFTDSKIIEKMLENGCTVELIVRLNDGTSPNALYNIYKKKGVTVKYYTSTQFHPKLYLIPNNCAFIGSSNLTGAALNTNNEVNIKIDYELDEAVFTELEELFADYWQYAAVLDDIAINKFKELVGKKSIGYSNFYSSLDEVQYPNNVKSENKKNKHVEFIKDFKVNYNRYVNAVKDLIDFYMETPSRRWPNVPLRIEIDRFLWWLGETQYKKDEWKINTKYDYKDIKINVGNYKPDFLKSDKAWLNNGCDNYFILNEGFKSKEKLMELDKDSIFELLKNVNSFHDSLRYHKDGLETLKEDFFEKNNLEDIKKSLSHLLFDKSPYYERLYDCIHGDYKLELFGHSSVKELFGYVNKEEYPIYNGRLRRSMAFLGFGLF